MLSVLGHARRLGASAVEPRAEAQAAYVAEIEKRMEGTVWVAGGCASWYLDATGRNSTIWPDFTWRFRRRVARLKPEEYVFSFPREAEARAAESLKAATTGEANYA
jgi:hypothetical protein